ncbi:MAG: dockerin type I domain-containing protein, partial [bacterium]
NFSATVMASIPRAGTHGVTGGLLTGADRDGTKSTVIYGVSVGNLTSSSATITWTTDSLTYGCINFGTGSVSEETAREDSWWGGWQHLVELEGLLEGTTYLFEVVSGDTTDDNGGAYYSFTTSPVGAGKPATIYGRIYDSDSIPAANVQVFATAENGRGASLPLVEIAEYDGFWAINLGNLKQQADGLPQDYGAGDNLILRVEGRELGRIVDTIPLLDIMPQDVGPIYLNSTLCGDADGSGGVNISDAVYLIQYIFVGGPAPDPYVAGDANCDGPVNMTDVVYLIQYIFASGAPPCDPDNDGVPDC